MKPAHRISRRRFLAAASSAIAAPLVLPSALWSNPPSNRIAMGFIGIANQGGQHLRACVEHPGLQILSVCDVDDHHLAAARDLVNARYAALGRAASPACAGYHDFRDLLARSDIDAVLVATPDHWHVPISLAAIRAGKDVYCEKPLSLTIDEGKPLVDAVRQYGRILQVGCQERSGRNARWACEMIRNQRLGALRHVIIGLPPHEKQDIGAFPEEPVPAWFDYDFWLGPAPWAPYTPQRCHYNFRFLSDYSGGEITNRGAHVGDLGLWGAWPFLPGPWTIQGDGTFYTGGLFNTARTYLVEFTCANGVRMTLDSSLPRGVKFVCDEGWLFVEVHGAALSASHPDILRQTIGPDDIRLHESLNQREDFFSAIRTRGPVVADVVEAHRSAVWCHLCNIAVVLKRKLRWDTVAERFIDDPEANRHLFRPMRSPWRL